MTNLNDPRFEAVQDREFIEMIQGNEQPQDGKGFAKVQYYDYDQLFEQSGFRYHLANELATTFFNKFIRPHLLREGGFMIRSDLRRFIDPNTGLVDLIMIGKIQAVQVETRPVVYRYISSMDQIPNDLHGCTFCGGYTKNDARGHCAACGGPRSNSKYIEEMEAGLTWKP